jgi:hypothetical protein
MAIRPKTRSRGLSHDLLRKIEGEAGADRQSEDGAQQVHPEGLHLVPE